VTGVVTISVELELAWGRIDKAVTGVSPRRKVETERLHSLLDLLDQLEIPITFDIVGHLLHTNCNGDHDPPKSHASWFQHDPGNNYRASPGYYAPDLVSSIINSEEPHDIGTHTYSHVLADEVTEEVIEWELNQSKRVFREFDLDPPISYVPPRHRMPSYEVLADHGIEIIREPFKSYKLPQNKVQKYFSLLNYRHPIQELPIKKESGILKTYCTPHMSLTAAHLPHAISAHSSFSLIPVRVRQWLHQKNLRRAIDAAIKSEGHIHLWTHLQDLGPGCQFSIVTDFLYYLSSLDKKGCVQIKTMAQLTGS